MISADVLGERARLTPAAPALTVIDPERAPLRWTYRQLDDRAVRAASAFAALGFAPGDRVALLAHNRVEFLELFFAAGKGAFVLVPLGTRLTAREIAPILADSGARALVHDGAFAEIVAALRALPGCAGVERWIALDAAGAGDVAYADLVAAFDGAAQAPAPPPSPEDLHCLLYTSGTTGEPKGVMIPHRQVAWNGYNTAVCWQLSASDVSPIFTPLYHAGGLFAFLVPIFTAGGRIVLHTLRRGLDPAEIWRAIAEERATIALGVPTIWQRLLEAPEFASADLSSLRCLMSGGAPLPLWIAEAYQARGLVFKQGFGMTEVGVNCFTMTAEESIAKRGSIGKPLMHTEARLADAGGDEVEAGEIGELWFRGPHLSLGYWNRPEANAAAFTPDGFFRSGDLARRDADGFYWIAGRAKEMFISGGVNVYPAEIEAALAQHPGVRDAAVVGVEDRRWGEIGVAFVVELEPGSAAESSILSFLGERLARYKLPKAVIVLPELPRTAYGKVVKGDLRERYLAGLERSGGRSE